MQTNTAGGLAARVGRWSAHHRKTAIFAWLAFVLAAVLIGGMTGTSEPTTAEQFNGETHRAETVLADAGFDDRSGEMVLVQSSSATVDAPAFRAALEDVRRAVSAESVVTNVVAPPAGGQVSEDGRSALVSFDITGDPDTAEERIAPVMAAVDRVAGAHPELTVAQFGAASAGKELSDTLGEDFKKAEMLSLPITLLILLVAFGALLAASVPVVLAMTAVVATIGLLGVASQLIPVDESAFSVILLVGLAVGVDYSLFYIRREREERAAGRDKLDAIEIAAATSGRAVLISGLTVIVAMAGMFLTGNASFMGMGLGTILVVAVAMLGSLTVLPATLALLGDRINKGRIPFLGRRSEARDSRAWGWLIDRVTRRPVVATVLAGGALLALSIPALGMQTKVAGIDEMPKDLQVVQAYDKISSAFPAEADPATVVVAAQDVNAPEVRTAIAQFTARAEVDPEIAGPVGVEVNPSQTVARLSVGLPGTGSDETSQRALEHLREDLLPATIERVDGVTADVSGTAAGNADFNELMSTRTPLVFAFVLGLAFLLLLVTFRSVVIPVKAILLNLLSVGAAYGTLKLVFQDGLGEGLLGFESNGAITSWLPLFLFVILFGLSMDYHVFILSRVREAWQAGMSSERAVAHGIKATAGTVTSAAVVMVAVFGIFATLSTLDMKQLGVGLAVAILIDATIVRGVLLPATMKLLGDWNWYLPRWLQWIPELEHEAGPKPSRVPRLGPEPVPAGA